MNDSLHTQRRWTALSVGVVLVAVLTARTATADELRVGKFWYSNFTPIEYADGFLRFQLGDVEQTKSLTDIHGLRFSWPDEGAPLCLRLATAALVEPVTVGGTRPGETMRPAGLNGTKKLQDLLVDRKIPASTRGKVSVLRAAGKVLAVLAPEGDRVLAVDEHAQPAGGRPTRIGVHPRAPNTAPK